MRNFIRFALLAPVLVASIAIPPLDEAEWKHVTDVHDFSHVVVDFKGPQDLGVASGRLSFKLQVLDSEAACGFGNITLDNQELPQSHDGLFSTGKGSLLTAQNNVVTASWTFQCILAEEQPDTQLLTFVVDSVDGNSLVESGFTVVFKQTVEPRVIHTILDIKESWSEAFGNEDYQEFTVDDDVAELEYLQDQLKELKYLIREKKLAIAERKGENDLSIIGCDSLKCVVQAIREKARKIIVTGMQSLESQEYAHFEKPHWPRPPFHHGKPGNHTCGPPKHGKGNHTHPHPPPHHRRPHLRLPFCHYPPHHGPPKHGKGNHTLPHPPPHHKKPHHPLPFCRPPPPPPPHHDPDHKPPFDGPGDHPPHYEPPFGGEPHHDPDHKPPFDGPGDHPPHYGPPFGGQPDHKPPFDGPDDHSPHHEPPREGEPSRYEADHQVSSPSGSRPMQGIFRFNPTKEEIPAPPHHPTLHHHKSHGPPGPKVFHLLGLGLGVFALTLIFKSLRHCCRTPDQKAARQTRRADRQHRRSLRRAARREAVHEILARLGYGTRSQQDEEKHAALPAEDDNDSTTLTEDIAGFRNAADMVSDMIAAEEGRGRGDVHPRASMETLPAYEDRDSSEMGTVVDGCMFTPGSSDYTPSQAGSASDILGADLKK